MNFIDLPAVKTAQGVVRLPGSKSISNRILLLAALADGITEIRDLLLSDDTLTGRKRRSWLRGAFLTSAVTIQAPAFARQCRETSIDRSRRRPGDLAVLYQDVQNLALAIDGAPQIHPLPIDRDEHRVQMPASCGTWV